ncbi:DUF3560 domain-containing protein [Kitasatospora sp. NPDC057541]|uniref:DUF3560 domain-containing protein n=1 Tax=unclassified Kitasatospora TaxID=2633591 RepID=UPI0036B8A6E9
MAQLTIHHTRRDGTLLTGTERGDGTAAILHPTRFRYSGNVGWYIPSSRDRAADRYHIDRAAEALRSAGHQVDIIIDEDTARPFAEAEAERLAAAASRAERFANRANRATATGEALIARADEGFSRIPPGQPILIGHHSEQRDRNHRERLHTTERRGRDELKRGQHWDNRAQAAAAYEQNRYDIPTTLRRIETLQAADRHDARALAKLAGKDDPAVTEYRAELQRRTAERAEELAHWRRVVADAEAAGAKLWRPGDFRPGDLVQIGGGRWWEVIRVNAKSLTVPGGPDMRPVVTVAGRGFAWNDRAPYDKVTGHRPAQNTGGESPAAVDPQPA